jgi:hypothetical protein
VPALASPFPESPETRGLRHGTWRRIGLPRVRDLLGMAPDPDDGVFPEALPFAPGDVTAGSENELQAVVVGARTDVDFPQTVEASRFYRNLNRRAAAGDLPTRRVNELRAFLDENPDGVWENSWVRFPRAALGASARLVFEHDLLADKTRPDGPRRADADRFVFHRDGEPCIRVPVSYLLKLSLADAIGREAGAPEAVRNIGTRLLAHFSNDNTSPETFSFHPVPLTPRNRMGRAVARETLKRFFLCQLLTLHANRKFGLLASGQRAMVYFAPNTHTRQKRLNELISDAFYRELFMSPCLSGWDRGEDKHRYMNLCHQTLSRSQLNAVSKLREAGIITRNLVVLPNLSNASLANNGTHVSLGSRLLTGLMADPASGFGSAEEKYVGDLVIKIVEHFLPLFVGTYSAAPYRLDFQDFHPERVLGFLPHELDFTHLRMLWRRWKKKADLKVFGHPFTPFGPRILDRWFSRIFRLRGDFVADFRLLDYFVALMSTCESPALDGCLGGDECLKRDLADFGVFDTAMPMYLFYRLRNHAAMGFSGFEGRYYSQFEDVCRDMGGAASIQNLVTALAFKLVLSGKIGHESIPDDPVVESERRQMVFGNAIGVPTFFVRRNTANRFLAELAGRTRDTRASRRYPGYVRIRHRDFRRTLLETLRTEAADLVEMMELDDALNDLEERLECPAECSASGRLVRGILDEAGARHPMALGGDAFNTAAERYYRGTLRVRQMREALDMLADDFRHMDANAALGRDVFREALDALLDGGGAWEFLERIERDVLEETVRDADLVRLVHLVLLSVRNDMNHHRRQLEP